MLISDSLLTEIIYFPSSDSTLKLKHQEFLEVFFFPHFVVSSLQSNAQDRKNHNNNNNNNNKNKKKLEKQAKSNLQSYLDTSPDLFLEMFENETKKLQSVNDFFSSFLLFLIVFLLCVFAYFTLKWLFYFILGQKKKLNRLTQDVSLLFPPTQTPLTGIGYFLPPLSVCLVQCLHKL